MKMRKMLAVVSALCMMCAVVPVLPVQESAVISANAEEEITEYTYENFKYTKSEEAVKITGYVEEPTGELVIPEEIDSLPVKAIGYEAFAECKEITSLTLPDTITYVNSSAFFCLDAHWVSASQNKYQIDSNAFRNCTGLTEINVSDTNSAFSSENGILFNKDKTELIRYPAGKTEESYTIPESVQKISNFAFSGCAGLKAIVFPENMTEIGMNVFFGTAWLNEKQKESPFIIINNILMDGSAYQGDVIIPEDVLIIGDNAFSWCGEITSVIVPKNVTSIGEQAFVMCFKLASVTIENPNCEIYDNALTFGTSHVISTGYTDFDGTIYGYEGSTAQAYAEQYERNFESLGSAPDTTEPKTDPLEQGDATGDGEIDILDVITVNKAVMGKETLSDAQLKAIDFNSNT